MRNLKNYENLYHIYCKSRNKFRVPTLIGLLVFVIAFLFVFIEFFPIELALLMMIPALPVIAIFGPCWLAAYLKTSKIFKSFSSQELAKIDVQLDRAESCGGIYVTQSAIIEARMGLYMLPTSNALWVYRNEMDVYSYAAPVRTFRAGKTTQLIVADISGKKYRLSIKNGDKFFNFIKTEMLKYKQDIVFGYEFGLDDIYKNDRERMIAFARENANLYNE